jgi:hypothetical protein
LNVDWLSLISGKTATETRPRNHGISTEGLCFEELDADWKEPESPGYCLVVFIQEQTAWAAGTRLRNPD